MLSHHQYDECMRELWWELNRLMSRASLQGAQGIQRTLSSTRTSRSRRHSWGCSALQTQSSSGGLQVRKAAKWPREDSPLDSLDHRSDVPNWWAGVGQDSTKALHQNIKGNPCHLPLAPKGLVIPVSGCVSSWETWSYRTGPGGPGVGHCKVGPLLLSVKALRSRSDLTLMKSYEMNPPCPLVWLSSCLRERPSSNIPLPPLLRWDLLMHHGLTVKWAPNGVPPCQRSEDQSPVLH